MELENARLEREGQFWAKEVIVKVEYKFCPNLTIIDTPGLISAAPGRRNHGLQASARAVEAMVRAKIEQREFIILCLEDCNDWSNATTRRLVMQARVGRGWGLAGWGAARAARRPLPFPSPSTNPLHPLVLPSRSTPTCPARWWCPPSWTPACPSSPAARREGGRGWGGGAGRGAAPARSAQPGLPPSTLNLHSYATHDPSLQDVELFLRPPGRLLEPGMLGGCPFFTSVPSGRVGAGKDARFRSNDDFRAAVAEREAADVADLERRMDRRLERGERARIGVQQASAGPGREAGRGWGAHTQCLSSHQPLPTSSPASNPPPPPLPPCSCAASWSSCCSGATSRTCRPSCRCWKRSTATPRRGWRRPRRNWPTCTRRSEEEEGGHWRAGGGGRRAGRACRPSTRPTRTTPSNPIVRLKEKGRTFREVFLAKLGLLLRGTVAAPPDRFGETLADEHVRGGAFVTPNGASLAVPAGLPNACMRLYGGAQYHRAMAEFRAAVGGVPCPDISREEIVNACGVDEFHDGVNYTRTACVIAVSKARDLLEPFLHQASERARV